MTNDALIEAILFYRGEPVSRVELAKSLKLTEEELRTSLDALNERLRSGGTTIVTTDDKVELRTHSDAAQHIEDMRREELDKDIGKAGSETLALILYRGPLSRSEIEYIRGVNSTFVLRNLLIRGLVERVAHPTDQRIFLYKATPDVLGFLGVRAVHELPEFETIQSEIAALEAAREKAKSDV